MLILTEPAESISDGIGFPLVQARIDSRLQRLASLNRLSFASCPDARGCRAYLRWYNHLQLFWDSVSQSFAFPLSPLDAQSPCKLNHYTWHFVGRPSMLGLSDPPELPQSGPFEAPISTAVYIFVLWDIGTEQVYAISASVEHSGLLTYLCFVAETSLSHHPVDLGLFFRLGYGAKKHPGRLNPTKKRLFKPWPGVECGPRRQPASF